MLNEPPGISTIPAYGLASCALADRGMTVACQHQPLRSIAATNHTPATQFCHALPDALRMCCLLSNGLSQVVHHCPSTCARAASACAARRSCLCSGSQALQILYQTKFRKIRSVVPPVPCE